MKTSDLKKRLAYLHACYVADNRELSLTDFLNKRKVEHPYLVEGKEELINDFSPKIALPEEYAEEVSKMARLYQKEKELLYGSLFLLGTDKAWGKPKKVCAPLLLFPAEIRKGGEYYFVYIDRENVRLNSSALRLLAQAEEGVSAEMDIMRKMPEFPFGYGQVGKLSRLLKKHYPQLDAEALLMYPELWNEKKLKRQLQPKQRAALEFFKLVPASGLGMIARSSDTYGILSELEELEKKRSFSAPLKAVFGEESERRPRNTIPPALPTVLNESQKRAVINARNETLSLVVGPPGTGKSYTIACMALDHLMRGQSVLITSKQDEAVDVVAQKITQLLQSDEVLIRGGAKSNLFKIRKQVRKLLSSKTPRTGTMESSLRDSFNNHNLRVYQTEEKLHKRLEQEMEWSEHLLGQTLSSRLRAGILKTFHSWYKPHWKLLAELEELLEKQTAKSREVIFANYNDGIYKLLRKNRRMLERLYQGLRSYVSSERDTIFKDLDYQVFLKAFPIWLCKLSDLYRILPQDKELFDLVIIDEASQCDMATSMAALQRAKRVVVCGDPNQLRHMSFLSKPKMIQQLEKCGLNEDMLGDLNFREMSFLDLVSRELESQEQVSFLEEHYRSVPEIIRFSNQEFYSNSLRIMNQRPIPSEGLGHFEIDIKGNRQAEGYNEVEGREILRRVEEIIHDEKDLEPHLKSSIGILSPLRDQVDYISKELSTRFSIDWINAHRISVGTAYAFQGEERDVMFLSFAVDPQSHHSAYVHINKPDVFNVSITRAKGRQYVVHSVDTTTLSTDYYLRMYLEDVRKGAMHANTETEHSHDEFMREVQSFLKANDLNYWTYFSIAGVPLDLLVKTKDGIKGIDLIGYPGKYEDALSVERFKILGRAGVPVFPLPYSFWLLQNVESKKELLHFMGN